jgi:hypothetical protein
MPFGGHQQICDHPALMRLPYFFHLRPRRAYGLAPREQARLVARVPGVRDFLTTSAYYLLARA